MPNYAVNVIVNPAGAVAGSRAARTAIAGVDTQAKALKTTLASTFAPLAGLFGAAAFVKTIASFEQEMATVKAVTSSTGEEFKSLRDEAARLGATTRFSGTEAAQGMLLLGRAGFETGEILDSIGDTLLLAQAGALDLATAANITANSVRGFRLEADEAGRVADVLARGANSANTTVQQLGDALKFVAPVAAGVGVSIEETVAAIGALSNAGLQGSLAGTGLRRVIAGLESPTQQMISILNRFGVSVDEIKVSSVGLTAAVTRLAEAGVDTGTALQLFGQRGGPAFEVLSSSIPVVEELTEKMENAGGTAEEIARIMDDTVVGAFKAFISAVQATFIGLGDEGTSNQLKETLFGLASLFRAVAANADILNVVLITLTIRAIAPLVAGMTAAIFSANGLRGALALLGGPVTALVTIVTALSLGFLVWRDRAEQAARSSKALSEALSGVENNIAPLKTSIEEYSQKLKTASQETRHLEEAQLRLVESELQLSIRDQRQALHELSGDLNAASFSLGQNLDNTRDQQFALDDLTRATIRLSEASSDLTYLKTLAEEGEEPIDTLSRLTTETRALFDAAQDASVAFGDSLALSWRVAANEAIETAARLGIVGERLSALKQFYADLADGIEDEAAAKEISAAIDKNAQDIVTQTLLDLQREAEILKSVGDERRIQNELLAIEKELRDKIRQADPTLSIQEVYARAQAAVEAESEAIEKQLELIYGLERQNEILEDIRGPAQDHAATIKALTVLYEEGAISIEEYNRRLRENEIEFLRSQNDAASGARAAVLDYFDEVGNRGDEAFKLVSDSIRKTEDALVDFVQTGKLEIGDLFRSILADYIRYQIRSIFSTIGGTIGGGGGGTGPWPFVLSAFGLAQGGVVGPDGSVPLRQYAGGGVARTPQLAVFGEGSSPEAFVPLPDGRTIPVTMKGEGGGGTTINIDEINVDARDSPNPAEVAARAQQAIREAFPLMIKSASAAAKAEVFNDLSRGRL